MPVFEFQAIDGRGKACKGLIEADTSSQARVKLRAQDRYPVSIKESRLRAKGRGWSLFERVSRQEISTMTRQLATLVGAGIPLVQSLGSMIDQSRNPALKKIIAQIRNSVNEGHTLTMAFAEHPRYFSPVFVNMVRAGEASGSLDIVLEKLADFREKQETLKSRLRAALVYPLFMAVIGVIILTVLITYIIPNITQVFRDMDRVLPLPTLFLIGLSDFLKNYWWGVLGGIVFLAAGIGHSMRSPAGRRIWDLVQLRVPIIGPVVHKVILARFAVTLGSLLSGGVGLLAAMQIVRALIHNTQVVEVVDRAMQLIEKGQSMTEAFSDSPWFPPTFVQMVAVGEQSGGLEKMLEKISTAYDREVEIAILAMTALLEPLLITAMGTCIGFIVLAILLPIFEMNQLLQ